MLPEGATGRVKRGEVDAMGATKDVRAPALATAVIGSEYSLQ